MAGNSNTIYINGNSMDYWNSLNLELQPPISYGKKGQVIQEQARELIARVAAFMKHEALTFQRTGKTKIPITSYKQRVLLATGVSEATYRHVCREATQVSGGVLSAFPTPRSGKRKTGKQNHLGGKKKTDKLKQTADCVMEDEKQEPIKGSIITEVFLPEYVSVTGTHCSPEISIKTENVDGEMSEELLSTITSVNSTSASDMPLMSHSVFSSVDPVDVMKTEKIDDADVISSIPISELF